MGEKGFAGSGSWFRESVLFIGTQFSNLYAAVDTPARGRVGIAVPCVFITAVPIRANNEVQDSFSSKGRVVSKGGGKYVPFNHTIYVCYSSKNAGGTCRSAILRDRLRFRREK